MSTPFTSEQEARVRELIAEDRDQQRIAREAADALDQEIHRYETRAREARAAQREIFMEAKRARARAKKAARRQRAIAALL